MIIQEYDFDIKISNLGIGNNNANALSRMNPCNNDNECAVTKIKMSVDRPIVQLQEVTRRNV